MTTDDIWNVRALTLLEMSPVSLREEVSHMTEKQRVAVAARFSEAAEKYQLYVWAHEQAERRFVQACVEAREGNEL